MCSRVQRFLRQSRYNWNALPGTPAPPWSYAHDIHSTLSASLFAAPSPRPALADVTLKSKGGGTGMVGAVSGDMTQYIKGLKIRTDQLTGKGRETTTIIDIVAKQMIVLNHDSKEADVIDMGSLSESFGKGWRYRHHGVAHTDRPDAPGRRPDLHRPRPQDVAVPMQMGNMTDDDGDERAAVPGQERTRPGRVPRLLRAASENGGFFDAHAGQDASGDGEGDDRHVPEDGGARRAVRDRDEDRHRSARVRWPR